MVAVVPPLLASSLALSVVGLSVLANALMSLLFSLGS
jgi:hypothetical protein